MTKGEINYKAPAKRTFYKCWHDSRLEAYWAAFFDQYRIEWQRGKPLGNWVPDFILSLESKDDIYVEVKPVSDIDDCYQSAVKTLMRISRYREILGKTILMVGKQPFPHSDSSKTILGAYYKGKGKWGHFITDDSFSRSMDNFYDAQEIVWGKIRERDE